jgi:surface antigen
MFRTAPAMKTLTALAGALGLSLALATGAAAGHDRHYGHGHGHGYGHGYSHGHYQHACRSSSGDQVAGAIFGAIIGGIIGNQFGQGSGRDAATIAGIIIGGAAGSQMARDLSCEDNYYISHAYMSGLQTVPDGRPYHWQSPYSETRGYFTPTRTYRDRRYGRCRQFTQTIYINGRPRTGHGTACRDRSGRWQIVS